MDSRNASASAIYQTHQQQQRMPIPQQFMQRQQSSELSSQHQRPPPVPARDCQQTDEPSPSIRSAQIEQPLPAGTFFQKSFVRYEI